MSVILVQSAGHMVTSATGGGAAQRWKSGLNAFSSALFASRDGRGKLCWSFLSQLYGASYPSGTSSHLQCVQEPLSRPAKSTTGHGIGEILVSESRVDGSRYCSLYSVVQFCVSCFTMYLSWSLWCGFCTVDCCWVLYQRQSCLTTAGHY